MSRLSVGTWNKNTKLYSSLLIDFGSVIALLCLIARFMGVKPVKTPIPFNNLLSYAIYYFPLVVGGISLVLGVNMLRNERLLKSAVVIGCFTFFIFSLYFNFFASLAIYKLFPDPLEDNYFTALAREIVNILFGAAVPITCALSGSKSAVVAASLGYAYLRLDNLQTSPNYAGLIILYSVEDLLFALTASAGLFLCKKDTVFNKTILILAGLFNGKFFQMLINIAFLPFVMGEKANWGWSIGSIVIPAAAIAMGIYIVVRRKKNLI